MKWLAAALAVAIVLLQYRVWFSEDGVRQLARLQQAVGAQRGSVRKGFSAHSITVRPARGAYCLGDTEPKRRPEPAAGMMSQYIGRLRVSAPLRCAWASVPAAASGQ